METVKFSDVEDKIILIRNEKVILDSDVAVLYGVETKAVNQAVKNNPDKFPPGYIFEILKEEYQSLQDGMLTSDEPVKNFDRFRLLKHSTVPPKAFTEKGLYMLATILKSPRATQTTLAIVEAFANIRELARTVAELSTTTEKFKQQSLMEKGGGIIADILGDDLHRTDTETSIELNFAVLKFKHTVKRKE